MNNTTDIASGLVSPEWLRGELGAPDLKLFDASFYLDGRNFRDEFERCHITGALPFDLDAYADNNHSAPHMLMAPADFCAELGRVVDKNDRVIVYDTLGLFSAARAWWNFRIVGHQQVAVLATGLPGWLAADGPTEQGPPHLPPTPGNPITPAPPLAAVASANDVARAHTTDSLVVDARPPARFNGDVPEPRPGIASGHIPGSHNLFFGDLLDNHSLRPPDELATILSQAGITSSGPPVISSCGSGVTACILALAMHQLGYPPPAIYDGSWSEWGSSGRPVAGPQAPAAK